MSGNVPNPLTSHQDSPQRTFRFIRSSDVSETPQTWGKDEEQVRKAIGEALNARNVAFLLGAGCSSMRREGKECGIPTMAPLAKTFCAYPKKAATEDTDQVKPPKWALTADEVEFLNTRGAKLKGSEYEQNLERLMELLHSLRFVFAQSDILADAESKTKIEGIITKVQNFLWENCTDGEFAHGEDSVLALYESFYRKLVMRDRSLPRPWVFTTNYDLFNERAMDRLGVPYTNGFSGVVERRFNPVTFRYALAEQLDLSNRKWTAVDSFIYLCKLHGSISWTEDDHGLFPIRETVPQDVPGKVMIYPTPAKQNSSLGSPYADLFREFQSQIVCEQSVLITVGFAFGDEHLNNIIYQALTIPTFRLIVFAAPDSKGEIAKLIALKDPRIWIIGGDGPDKGSQAHYFDTIVKYFLPQRPVDRIDDAVRLVQETFGRKSGEIENGI